MNRAQTISTIFLLPIAASLLLVGGLYMMDNGNGQPEQTGNPEVSSLNRSDGSADLENVSGSSNDTGSNQSIRDEGGTHLNFLKQERIRPVTTGKNVNQTFSDLLGNRTDLAQQILRPQSSIVFLYEGPDSQALFLINTPGSSNSSVNLTIEGLDTEEVTQRGGSFVNRSEEAASLYSIGWTPSNSTEGAAFVLKDSEVNVTIRPEFSGEELDWKLVSGPRENLSFLDLDRERPLDIDTG